MRVLLVGEYSGVHTDLAAALRNNGHYVITAHAGDDFKNYPRDIDLRPRGPNFLSRRIDMVLKYKKLLNFLDRNLFDIIQFINVGVLPRGLDKIVYKRVFKTSAKVFFLGAGEDHIIWSAYRDGAYRYYAFDGMQAIDGIKGENKWDSPYLINLSNEVLKRANAIIPLCVEYKIAYDRHFTKTPFIPMSVNPSLVSYTGDKKSNKKIKILHGLNRGREGYKGSNFIIPALDVIKQKYSHKADVIISESMPFLDYIKLLSQVDIVIDQCLCYSVSMNALYSMLNGCVVLGGCEKEYLDSLAVDSAPVINILPKTIDIIDKIENLINNPADIELLGKQSYVFVRKYHSIYNNVNKFIDVWNRY